MSIFRQNCVNMFIPAVKLNIFKCGSTGADSVLKPLVAAGGSAETVSCWSSRGRRGKNCGCRWFFPHTEHSAALWHTGNHLRLTEYKQTWVCVAVPSCVCRSGPSSPTDDHRTDTQQTLGGPASPTNHCRRYRDVRQTGGERRLHRAGLQSGLNTARLSLWELARQTLQPQSEILSTTTVVIDLFYQARFFWWDSVHVPRKRAVWSSSDSSSSKNGSLPRCLFQSGEVN